MTTARGAGLVPRRVFVGGVAVLFGWWFVGPVGALVVATVVLVGPVVVARRGRARTDGRLAAEVAAVFELAARSVRAGETVDAALVRAVRSVGGPGGELVDAALLSGRAVGVVTSTSRPVRRVGSRATRRGGVGGGAVDTGAIVAAVGAMTSGAAGGGARGLEAGAVLLRDHVRANAEIAAAATHVRASAVLLVTLPAVFAAAMLLLVPGSTSRVLTDPRVAVTVSVGVACEAVGAWWTRRMIRAAHTGRP